MLTPPSVYTKKNKGGATQRFWQLDKEVADFWLKLILTPLMEEVSKNGELSEKNKNRLGKAIDYCTELAEKLEKEMLGRNKKFEKVNFRKALYLNPPS